MNIHANIYWYVCGNVCFRRINLSKSLGSSACSNGDAVVRNLERAQSRVHVDQFVSALRVVQVPVLVCLRNSCKHMTELGRP